jgi:hypothetical protein
MPLFNDRRGNGGTGKGTLVNPLALRRASSIFTKHLPVAIEANRRYTDTYESTPEPMMDPPKELTDYRSAFAANDGVLMWPDDRKAMNFSKKVAKFPGSKAERKFTNAQAKLGISDDDMQNMHGMKKPFNPNVFD